MLTDAPPRKANRAGFLESERIKTLDLPQDGRLLAIAQSIESAMDGARTVDVRRACTEFLETTSQFYRVPDCDVRVLAARLLRVRESWSSELFGDYNPETMMTMLALAHTFSPTLFNEFKFGVNRAPFHNPQASVLPYDVTLDSGQFTELFNNNTDNEVGTTLGWIDNLSLTRGRSTFKMGIEIRRVRLNQGITADNNYAFPDASGLINDQLSSIAFRASWCCHGLRHTFVLPYFQDEWKVRPNITLNLASAGNTIR